eukprot:sb/3473289/
MGSTSLCVLDWTAVIERDVLIPWDLEETPLQIKTNSTLGSGDMFRVQMHDKNGNKFSTVYLIFRDKTAYHLPPCTGKWIDLPVQPPVEVEKIWTIAKTESGLIIMCNSFELLNFQFADCRIKVRVARRIFSQNLVDEKDHWYGIDNFQFCLVH